MAVIQPSANYDRDGITQLTWADVTENDTCAPYMPRQLRGAVGSVQASGTFGGATVGLGVNNDGGANFYDLEDVSGDAIALTTAGLAEFSTSALWIAPQIANGSSQSVTVVAVLRG